MTDDLLNLAEQIARTDAGRPRQVNLRRSVSTAYYAAFHAYCDLCAATLVGQKPWKFCGPVYRSIEHGAFRSLTTHRDLGPSVRQLLVLTVELQEQRHEADYNPEQLFLTRSSTLTAIAKASAIKSGLNLLSLDDRLHLAVLLVARRR